MRHVLAEYNKLNTVEHTLFRWTKLIKLTKMIPLRMQFQNQQMILRNKLSLANLLKRIQDYKISLQEEMQSEKIKLLKFKSKLSKNSKEMKRNKRFQIPL